MTCKPIVSLAAMAASVTVLANPVQAHGARGYYEHQDWCTHRIHDNGVAGALVGGAAGALIGNGLAHGGGRLGGTLLGAAAGAAIGSNVARGSTKYRCRGPHEVGWVGYPPPPVYAPPPVYVAPEPVYLAPPPPPPYGAIYYEPVPHGHARGYWRHHHHERDDDDGDE